MGIQIQDGQRVVYQADSEGFYVGEVVADPDPQNHGQWLIPAGCVETKPPSTRAGKKYQWSGYKWKAISE